MAQESILLQKKTKVKKEEDEVLLRLQECLEDAKAGRVRRVR